MESTSVTYFSKSGNWRNAVIIGLCVVVGGTALALMIAGGRAQAIAAAKRHGRVEIPYPGFMRIDLHNRKALDEVLPLLTSVSDLHYLSLGGAELTAENLRAIGELKQIHTLSIGQSNLDDDDLGGLSPLTNLRELRLARNPITDAGLKHLAPLKNLEILDLSFTSVRGTGLQHVTPTLRQLDLTRSLLDDESIEHCKRFPRLAVIYFANTKVTQSGLMKLTDLHLLNSINHPAEISREAVETFREKQLESITAAADAEIASRGTK
jgi:hypothetical protein